MKILMTTSKESKLRKGEGRGGEGRGGEGRGSTVVLSLGEIHVQSMNNRGAKTQQMST